MVARVNQARLNPSDIQAAKEFLHGVVAPAALTQDGFKSVMMLSREDGHTLVIELYETEEQVRATETTGWYQRTTEVFAEKIKGQVRRNVYEVTVGADVAHPEPARQR